TRSRPFDFYRTCRAVNPSPFMFFLRQGPVTLIGASPEIMVRVEGDLITTRPLAGTRKRGATDEEDDRLAAELAADPKERAEHIMLVDLAATTSAACRASAPCSTPTCSASSATA